MWPTRSAPSSPSAAGAVSRSATRSTARSEPGSRPTRAAGRERPSAASTVMPSSIPTVWSGGALGAPPRRAGGGAEPVERLEESIDVVAVAVHVRRHADAPFATPDQHPQAGEPPRETGRVVGQEADVAGTLRGRLRREDREAARAQPLDQPPAQADRVLLHRLGGQLFQARERGVPHREAEQARVTRLEP